MSVPKYDDLFNPVINTMRQLGGSASVSEIEEQVANNLNLTDKQINEIHRGSTTKLSYRLAWTRNYLKRYGVLENSARGVWALTKKGNKTKRVGKEKVNKFVKQLDKKQQKTKTKTTKREPEEVESWKDDLMEQIMQLKPSAFENLCQRILRESGFEEVKVIGRSGDGGIDGRGKLRVGGILTFRVVFQCKRHRNSIPAKVIREFRGSMQGRTDRGLFITTANYTRGAKIEAEREGAPNIDLIDGEMLVEKMIELGLGVTSEEVAKIEKEFFESF